MWGVVILVVAMLIAFPFGLFVAGACWSALLGTTLAASAAAKAGSAGTPPPA